MKDLGITFDVELKFSKHIDSAAKKAHNVIFMIFRNIMCSDAPLLTRLYKAYVLCLYETQVWYNVPKKCVKS